jgi:hypothetical protein
MPVILRPDMKQRLTAILLIISIISCSFSRFFIYAGFQVNKGYIASKLCENRNRPWLHCNGKCYLMKKIRQAEQKQDANDRQAQKNLIQEAFCEKHLRVRFYTHLLAEISIPNGHIILPTANATIFRPPQLG